MRMKHGNDRSRDHKRQLDHPFRLLRHAFPLRQVVFVPTLIVSGSWGFSQDTVAVACLVATRRADLLHERGALQIHDRAHVARGGDASVQLTVEGTAALFGDEFQDSPVAEYACASRLRQGGSVAYPACLVSTHFHGGF